MGLVLVLIQPPFRRQNKLNKYMKTKMLLLAALVGVGAMAWLWFSFSCPTLWQGANPQANLFLPLNRQPRESAMNQIRIKMLLIPSFSSFTGFSLGFGRVGWIGTSGVRGLIPQRPSLFPAEQIRIIPFHQLHLKLLVSELGK